MFHVKLLVFLLSACAVAPVWAGDESKSALSPLPSSLSLALATPEEEARRQTQRGMLDLLLGWDESARVHLKSAMESDSHSALAFCGYLMTQPERGEKEKYLNQLAEILQKDVPATPAESFYISTFLKLLSGDHLGAADDFCLRADTYRADLFSACWGILLLHCVDQGYGSDGQILPNQKTAVQRADKLYAQFPDDPCVCFVRAYIEKAAPNVSPTALEACQKAVLALPGHPAPEHLLGHLLYRTGRIQESISHFVHAAEFAHGEGIRPEEAALEISARLYESTALWSIGHDGEALATRKALNAQAINSDVPLPAGSILLKWEAHTLPLRVLVAREKLPSIGEISAASKTVSQICTGNQDPLSHVRGCLSESLYARIKMSTGDLHGALASLQRAEKEWQELEGKRNQIRSMGSRVITPWVRALEACSIALCRAKADIYQSTAEIWNEKAKDSVQPIALVLPPVIPERGDHDPACEICKEKADAQATTSPVKKKTNSASSSKKPHKKKKKTKK